MKSIRTLVIVSVLLGMLAGMSLPAAAGLWDGATDLGGGWKRLDWFGTFYDATGGWIYHLEHGWVYCIGATTADMWLYMDIGWAWTSQVVYSYMYMPSKGAWMWYLPGTSNPRWFYNVSTGQWTYAW